MILRFGAKNFFSFKEGVDISFELDKNCPKEISSGKNVGSILCFKGSNGSGKTNALKILPLLNYFCCNSFLSDPDDKIFIGSFFDNTEPIELYVEFVKSDVKYLYELSVTQTEVLSERISRKKSRFVPVIIREKNKLTKCIDEYKELSIVKLRANASIISTAFQYEIGAISEIYQIFKNVLSNVSYFGMRDGFSELDKLFALYYKWSETLSFTKQILKKFDTGIVDIEMHKELRSNRSEKYYPIFYFDEDKKKYLTYYDQSSGTKALFRDLVLYQSVLDFGGILVMDEFDSNLHPLILPELLEFFLNPEINTNNAQLIFTTHNSDIMNFMGKYRTYLINKEDNESYGYRLDEIKGDILRNDRSISKLYNAGKIGGVPRL